jgi:hypothetical protein
VISQLVAALSAFADMAAAGVLVWAVQTRLASVTAWLRGRYAPHPSYAGFDSITEIGHVWLECGGECAHLSTPHELEGNGTATCAWCGTPRAMEEATDGR